MDCFRLIKSLSRLLDLQDKFLEVFSDVEERKGHRDLDNKQKIDYSLVLMAEIQLVIKDIENILIPEFAKSIEIKKQYEFQVKMLLDIGLLEKLSNGQEGIRGIDGQEYPIPTFEQIIERIKANQELLETKVKQGFVKLQLVPFALPFDNIINKYRQALIKEDEKFKEIDGKKVQGIKLTDGTIQRLNENKPVWIWDKYQDCDNLSTPQDRQIEYQVLNYDGHTKEERGGKYKSELLKDPNNAWQIMLIEDLPDLPASGQGQTKATRKQLEANKTAKEYLKLLQDRKNHPEYQGEQGQTPEAALITYLTYLQEQQLAIDDHNGQGKSNYLAGNFLSGQVPNFYWPRGFCHTELTARASDDPGVFYGFRSAVSV